MPFWPLIITSGAFLLPAVIAKRRGKRGLGAACKVLTCTSMAFHSNLFNPWAFFIDRAYVHAFAVFFGAKSVWDAATKYRMQKRYMGMCSTMIVPISIYIQKVRKTHGIRSQLWHVAFHVSGQACVSLYAVCF